MAYERVQKSFGKSSSQKKQSKFAPPPIDQQIETDSLPSVKVSKSIIPSKEEREAIRRSLFEEWGNVPQKQGLTNTLQDVPASLSVTGIPIQAKLTIGAPGDKYEQEADRVAAQVVNQINAPVSQQPNQNLQQKEISEEELQMKPMLQLQAGVGGLAATAEVESSIQQARGSGQPLADNIRAPMEQALGADFSEVKVHTDAKADQLNQSIQARAFTTGQDVFFRQGEYSPGSRGGQELIAHELTHVVQQNNRAVQRSQQTGTSSPQNAPTEAIVKQLIAPVLPSLSIGQHSIQRGGRGSKEEPEPTLDELLNGKKNPNDYKKGVCYDAAAYVQYIRDKIAEEQLEKIGNDNYPDVLKLTQLWTGEAIARGEAVGFFRVKENKFFHVSISTGGTNVRGVNGHLLGPGWSQEVNFADVLGARQSDDTYIYDGADTKVFISSL